MYCFFPVLDFRQCVCIHLKSNEEKVKLLMWVRLELKFYLIQPLFFSYGLDNIYR